MKDATSLEEFLTPEVETQEQFVFREEIVTAVALAPGVDEEAAASA